MKNTLTKFLLLIDYHGEYKLMLNNDKTRDYVYENIEELERIEHLTCLIEHPSNLVEPLQPEKFFMQNEILNLKKENELLKLDNNETLKMCEEKLEDVIKLQDLCLSLEERFFIEKTRADVAVLRLDDEMKQQIHLLNEAK
jgi:hypothetical protein|tara:strand:- start:39 stop:461 length:423 start_codon:yes stop_codon:yes gene_type:complete